MTETVAGIDIPDSPLTREATQLVRDATGDLLFHHSRRVFLFGSLQGRRLGLAADPVLLYVGAMFHDLGLTERYRRDDQRFDLDGADEARRFLAAHGVPEQRIRLVWQGIGLRDLAPADVAAVTATHPRPGFEEAIVDAFAEGLRHRPDTTFGTVNGDVLEHRVPGYRHVDFVDVITGSDWPE